MWIKIQMNGSLNEELQKYLLMCSSSLNKLFNPTMQFCVRWPVMLLYSVLNIQHMFSLLNFELLTWRIPKEIMKSSSCRHKIKWTEFKWFLGSSTTVSDVEIYSMKWDRKEISEYVWICKEAVTSYFKIGRLS